MRVNPLEISLQGGDQRVDCLFKVVAVPAENPVELSERFRHFGGIHIALDEWY